MTEAERETEGERLWPAVRSANQPELVSVQSVLCGLAWRCWSPSVSPSCSWYRDETVPRWASDPVSRDVLARDQCS